jgi:asparagine synthase (glutamine-hydrolysing)
MNTAQRHRGPDDEGSYVDRATGIALGARRLSIIDVEGGHQPLSNEDGTVWAALNGEIYNHPALRKRLLERGHRLSTGTDTEVLVHLYEEYGQRFVHALEGMFAFALWDTRRRRLLVGRDRFGEKPLFYIEEAGRLTFASELTALLAGVSADRDLDPAAIDSYFVYGYVSGPRSIARDVCQLPPGHLLVWDHRSKEAALERYWCPPQIDSGHAESIGELVGETARLLELSVRSRMIADVPLGVLLSGGVDSSLIAALASRCSPEPVKSFTVGYDVGGVSETDVARRMARELGTDHHEITLTEADVEARTPRLLASLDQPIADQALIAMHAVAEFARRDVTVVVGGEGADELFGGYPRYRWLARADRFGRLVPAPLAARGAEALRALPRGNRARRLADVIAPQPALERHIDWVTERRRHLRSALYGPRLHADLVGERIVEELAAHMNGAPDSRVAGEFMRLDQQHWLPGDVLAKADRASMLVSLEVRTPYLHREVAEFAAAVPPEAHTRRSGKALLRSLLADLLPAAGRRPKTAFRVPVADWLRGPLSASVATQLREGALYEEGWFVREESERMFREHAAGRQDWSHVLWPLLALGLWLDRFRGRERDEA